MKRIMLAGAILGLCAIGGSGCATERYATAGADSLLIMTNSEIIDLSKAGISDSIIVAMMDTRATNFHLQTPDVIALADSGVSQNVINAMIKQGGEAKESASRVLPDLYWPYGWYAYDSFWWPWYTGPYYGVRLAYPHYRFGGFYRGGTRFRGRHG